MSGASSINPAARRTVRRKRRGFRMLWWATALVLSLVLLRSWYAFRDRTPGYHLEVRLPPAASPTADFLVGFGRVRITPDLASGRPVYMAGFGQNRVAERVHDDLWAVACVLDDGDRRIGVVALDAIGFFHDDVVRVRQRLPAEWRLDYVMICSTHNHSTPDLLGLWGPRLWRSGVDPEYLEGVRQACVEALGAAVEGLEPARLVTHHLPCDPHGLVTDTRLPEVYDADLRILQFLSPETGRTLGSWVNWGNHPETPWSKNRDITADFCGVLRDALEHGVRDGEVERLPALGGVHLFLNGAVGGLMTTAPGVTVRDPWTDRPWREPSHEKSRALGLQLAARIVPVLRAAEGGSGSRATLGIWARTIEVRVTNWRYWLAGWLGVLDRGYVSWPPHVRSEVALLRVGDATMACVPGELYPEIANGGVDTPEGADFPGEPVEVPPLREAMPGRLKLVVGLANDELGYLIPRTQWDERPPFTYGRSHPPYGEINSCGPDAAGTVFRALMALCREAAAQGGDGNRTRSPR